MALAVNVDDVESDRLDSCSLQRQPLTGEASDAFLLLWPDGKYAGPETLRATGLDLDERSDLRSPPNEANSDQIELTGMTMPIALDDHVALLLVPMGSSILAKTAEGLIVSCHDEPSGQDSELGVARHQRRCEGWHPFSTSGSCERQPRTRSNIAANPGGLPTTYRAFP